MFDGSIISVQLQVLLIIGCLFTYWYIIRKIKKANVRIDDVVIWIIGLFILLIFSIFPKIPTLVTKLIGVEAAVNTIFFMVIFFLFMMVFLLTVKISQLQEKLKDLTHQLALASKQENQSDID